MSRLRKKDLKSPDQIWQASAQTFGWLRSNWLLAVILVVVLFMGLVAYLYYREVQKINEAKAEHSYGRVLSLYEQWTLEQGKKTDKAADKKNGDSLKELNAALGNLAKKFPHSRANAFADLFRAKLALRDGKTTEAAKLLDNYKEHLPESDEGLGLYPLAVTYENEGKWNEALKEYNRILNQKDSALRKWALLGKARALKNLKRNKEAADAYQDFLDEFPKSPELSTVRGLKTLSESSAQ